VHPIKELSLAHALVCSSHSSLSENENFHHEKPTRQVLNPQKVFHVKTGQERDVIKEEKE
jgi:hypothetical protein